MDLTSLMSTLLSSGNLGTVESKTGASASDTMSVLAKALPSLLGGATAQANDASTAESFHEAVTSHASRDPEEVDLDEGNKIVSHLLGSNTASETKSIAKSTGLSTSQVTSIMSAAAPIVMNMLGKQTTSQKSTSASSTASILGSLLGSTGNSNSNNTASTVTNVASVLGSLAGSGILGGSSNSSSSSKKKSSGSSTADLVSGLMGLLK